MLIIYIDILLQNLVILCQEKFAIFLNMLAQKKQNKISLFFSFKNKIKLLNIGN